MFKALGIHQGDIPSFFDAVDDWEDWQKINVILAVGEAGYDFNLEQDNPDQFDIQIYECDRMEDLVIEFIDEGLFGEIPEALQNYIDFDAIGRDLSMDYTQTCIAGTNYIYRID